MHRSRQNIKRARLVVAGTVVVGGAASLLFALPAGTWEAWIESIPTTALLMALTILPVFGFPITALYIATGARFGLVDGTIAVAAATVAHLLLGYWLAHRLERPIRHILSACGWELHQVDRTVAWPFASWVALLPGVPYGLTNLISPLAGVSLRVFFGAAFPLHVATAVIGLALGRVTIDFSWILTIVLVAYGAVLVWLTRRLARHFRQIVSSHAGPDSEAFNETPDRISRVNGPR